MSKSQQRQGRGCGQPGAYVQSHYRARWYGVVLGPSPRHPAHCVAVRVTHDQRGRPIRKPHALWNIHVLDMALLVLHAPPQYKDKTLLPPLYTVIDGAVGPFAPGLIDAWRAAGVGGTCVRCSTVLELGWQGPECPTCELEYQWANGCRCAGTNLCPDCKAAGATDAKREPKCNPDCSTLCPICCPDD